MIQLSFQAFQSIIWIWLLKKQWTLRKSRKWTPASSSYSKSVNYICLPKFLYFLWMWHHLFFWPQTQHSWAAVTFQWWLKNYPFLQQKKQSLYRVWIVFTRSSHLSKVTVHQYCSELSRKILPVFARYLPNLSLRGKSKAPQKKALGKTDEPKKKEKGYNHEVWKLLSEQGRMGTTIKFGLGRFREETNFKNKTEKQMKNWTEIYSKVLKYQPEYSGGCGECRECWVFF